MVKDSTEVSLQLVPQSVCAELFDTYAKRVSIRCHSIEYDDS